MSDPDEVLPEFEAADEPARSAQWVRRLKGIAVDVTPLRESPGFRRLWIGETVSLIGTQMTAVAVPLQVYRMTGSSFAVGLLGLAALLPLVTFGLIGGAIADAVDRRKLALVTSTGLMVVSVALLAQSLVGHDQVWLLYVLIALQAGLFATDSPARRTIVMRLLPSEQIPAATALNQVLFNIGVVAGPLLAGTIIGTAGLRYAYALDVVSFAAALWAIRGLPPMPPLGEVTAAGLRAVAEGLRYLRGRPVLLMTFAVDVNAMVFGMPRALFPAFAENVFGGGAQVVGLLYAAPALGALVGALLGGWFGRINRQGLAVLVAVAVWGAAIAGFGLTGTLWLAVVLLAVAGAADMVSAVFRTAILQAATPDEMRGRLSGVHIVVVAGGPRLGDVEAGVVAAATTPVFSVVSGGLVCVAGVVLLALAVPRFARYDARNPVA